MGRHSGQGERSVTAAPAPRGYPHPTAYRRDPVTGIPTPPDGAVATIPADASHTSYTAPTGLRSTRAPLVVAAVGAAIALLGIGSQLPGLAAGVQAGVMPTSVNAAPAAVAGSSPVVARQCATLTADALDDTLATLGRTRQDEWVGVVDAHEGELAATYGTGSPEYRAYVRGAGELLGVLQSGAPIDGTVSTRVAGDVARTCGV